MSHGYLKMLIAVALLAASCSFKSLDKQLFDLTKEADASLADVEKLLAKGARIDVVDEDGNTALINACRWGRADIAQRLIEAGANVAYKNRNGRTALSAAAEYASIFGLRGIALAKSDYIGLIKLLIGFGADPNEIDNDRPLLVRVLINQSGIDKDPDNAEVVRVLIEAGAKVTDVTPFPLFIAAMNDRAGAIGVLLSTGKVDIETKNSLGQTALFLAVQSQKLAALRALLQRGAVVEIVDANKKTPLHLAAEQGDEAIVDALLQANASLNPLDAEGKTPLHRAVGKGNAAIVGKLLARGVDASIKDGAGFSPLKLATWANRTEIVEKLKSAGATE